MNQLDEDLLEKLALRSQKGEAAAQKELFKLLLPRVEKIINIALHCSHCEAAKDLKQDFFAYRLPKALKNYTAQGKFFAFFRVVLKNHINDYWRTLTARMRRITHIPEINPPPELWDVSLDEEWPEEQQQAYNKQVVEYLLSCLPEVSREILEQHYQQGKTLVQIADEMKMTYSNVTVLHFRAKGILRKMIGEKELTRDFWSRRVDRIPPGPENN